MITAVDTNVLLDVLLENPKFADQSLRSLEDSSAAGSLVICDIVFAELCVHFASETDCARFLEETNIRVESLDRPALFLASRVWRAYRRRGGKRNRILSDFLIGAHAQRQASRLLSRDRGFYRDLFPSLPLVDPSD